MKEEESMKECLDQEPKKMCIFCHAQVAVDARICPFCRAHFDQVASQTERMKPVEKNRSTLTEKQTLDSLYPPPYQPKMERIEEDAEEEKIVEKKEVSKSSSLLIPIFLFSVGSQLLIFSIFLLLFSEEGMLFLRWKASLWYLYLLVSVGFLYTGYYLFSKTEEESLK